MRERIEHTEHRRPAFSPGTPASRADETPDDRPVADRPAVAAGGDGRYARTSRP